MNETPSEYLSRIGKLGGKSRSAKKLKAIKRNLVRARKEKKANERRA